MISFFNHEAILILDAVSTTHAHAHLYTQAILIIDAVVELTDIISDMFANTHVYTYVYTHVYTSSVVFMHRVGM